MPDLKVKPIIITTFVDADHAHDLETRRFVTGVLMFLNKTPIHWCIMRQNTVETSNYVSELVEMRIAMEFTMAMHYELRMIGAPIDGQTQILGDNDSVVTSFSITSGTLKNNHNGIYYHQNMEAEAAVVVILASNTRNITQMVFLPSPLVH